MPTNEAASGVSNCYVFKSRLQEYAQKAGISTPVYETIKEGPSHEPSFKSAVIVKDARYESLPGFFNRKAAEQSAAEVALVELAKLGEIDARISQPVHETGLCKNLLQEYAQKMNYAIPMYLCRREEAPGRVPHFSCTVEIGAIRYIGAAAKTKKEAEIKAARTALIAIQSSAYELSDNPVDSYSQLTVIPGKKRGAESVSSPVETANVPKAKKPRYNKKTYKGKRSRDRKNHHMGADEEGSKMVQTNAYGLQVVGSELLATEAARNYQEGRFDNESVGREMSHHYVGDSQNVQSAAAISNQINHEAPILGTSSMSDGDIIPLAKEVSEATGFGMVASVVNSSTAGQIESSCVIPRITHAEERISAVDHNMQSAVAISNQINHETPVLGTSSMSCGDKTPLAKQESEVNGIGMAAIVVNNSIPSPIESSCLIPQPHNTQSTAAVSDQINHEAPVLGTSSMPCGDKTPLAKQESEANGIGMEATVVNNSIPSLIESSCLIPQPQNTQSAAAVSNQINHEAPVLGTSSISFEDIFPSAEEVSEATGFGMVVSVVNNSTLGQIDSSCVIPRIIQAEERISTLDQIESSCVIPGIIQAEERISTPDQIDSSCVIPGIIKAEERISTPDQIESSCVIPGIIQAEERISTLDQIESSCVIPGIIQAEERIQAGTSTT